MSQSLTHSTSPIFRSILTNWNDLHLLWHNSLTVLSCTVPILPSHNNLLFSIYMVQNGSQKNQLGSAPSLKSCPTSPGHMNVPFSELVIRAVQPYMCLWLSFMSNCLVSLPSMRALGKRKWYFKFLLHLSPIGLLILTKGMNGAIYFCNRMVFFF